jgi:hypothetical protein
MKVIAEFGPYKAVQAKAGVLAVYRCERFVCNLRKRDAAFAAPAFAFRKWVAGEAAGKEDRAARVAAGRARKAAAIAASKAAAGGEQMNLF